MINSTNIFIPFVSFDEFKKSTFNLKENQINIILKSLIHKNQTYIINSPKNDSDFEISHVGVNNMFYKRKYTLKNQPSDETTQLFFKFHFRIFNSSDYIHRFDFARLIKGSFLQNKIENLTFNQAQEALIRKQKSSKKRDNCSFYLIREEASSEKPELWFTSLVIKNGNKNFIEHKVDLNASDEDFLNFFHIKDLKMYIPFEHLVSKKEIPLSVNAFPSSLRKRTYEDNADMIPVKKLKPFQLEEFDNNILHIPQDTLADHFATKLENTWALVYFNGFSSPHLVIKKSQNEFNIFTFPHEDLLEIKHMILEKYDWENRFNSPCNLINDLMMSLPDL